MRVMAFQDARAELRRAMDTSQQESVLITVHGRPAAMLIGVQGHSLDEIYTKTPEFWRMIEERQRSAKRSSIEDVRAEIAQQAQKRTATATEPRSRPKRPTRRKSAKG